MKKENENIDLNKLKQENSSNGFKTPEGYFSKFQNELKSKLELSEIDSILSQIPKKNNFKVPNDYQTKIASVLNADGIGTKKGSRKGVLRTMYWSVAAAAAIWIGIVAVRSFENRITGNQLAAHNITVGDFQETEVFEVENEENPMISYLGDELDETFFEDSKITIADFQSSFAEEWDEEDALF